MIEEIERLKNSELVQTGQSWAEQLNKKLCLSQTRWVCRYGTLSDGHEKITPAQRYFQAIREMWTISNSVVEQHSSALEAKADLIDAEEAASKATKVSDTLRAQAKIQRAQARIKSCTLMVQDQLRMLDEYNKVRLELEPEVEMKYPLGVEQAEPDNWKAVAEYRALKSQFGGTKEPLTNIPLPSDMKAKEGLRLKRLELAAWDLVAEKENVQKFFNGDIVKFLENKGHG